MGLCAASLPVFGITGAVVWWRRRSARPRIRDNVPAGKADTVILVGSEGNTTWGFATTLHAALTAAGHSVHTTAMNDLAPVHARADRMLILTATAGDGAAPASAKHFLARLAKLDPSVPVAVLGFGDRTFPQFCRFAQDVSECRSRTKGWPILMPLKRVDRQSAQEFAEWGRDLGAVLGHDLLLEHAAASPKTTQFELLDREDYGAAVGARVAILRFRAPARRGAWQGRPSSVVRARRSCRDRAARELNAALLLARVVVAGRRSGDLRAACATAACCSTFLHGLRPGERVEAFIRENPGFRPD